MLEPTAWKEFVSGLDAADVCGVLVEVDSGRIVWAGARFSAFVGMTVQGLLSHTADTLFPKAVRDVLGESHGAGRVCEFPLQVITADRGVCRAAADLNPVRLDDREYTLVKIHQSRSANENLGSDAQFRALVDTFPAPALIWRPDTYEVLYINRALEDLWGHPRAHMEGRRVDDFVLNLDQLKSQLERRLKGESYSPVEFQIRDEFNRMRTWIGSSSVIDYDGAVALITAVTDVTARDEIEQALRRSEHRFSLLVNSVPEGIIVHCGGEVVFANPMALEMLGCQTLDELKEVPVIQLVHPDDRPVVAERIRKIIDERLHLDPVHERIRRRNGTWVDVEVTGSPTEFDGEPAALIIARDISERITREAALRESENKYRTLVESVNDTIFQLDAAGRFTFFSNCGNPEFLTNRDVAGRRFDDFVHPADLDALKASFNNTLSGTLEPHEFRVKGKKTDWRHVRTSSRPIYNSNGELTGLIGVMVDLTDRIEQENALRENAAKLKEATKIARISTWELNPATGEWAMSREIFDSLGIEDLPEKERIDAFTRLVPDEDFARLRDLTLEAIRNTGQVEAEFRCVLPGGEVRHLRTAAHVERASDGTPVRVYGATQDITARKRQEEERLQIEVQLQRAQKLDSLTVLAGGVAHDFNNLLTGILGYSELLKNAVTDEKLVRYVDEVQNITRRAADLTRQLLAYSGRGKFLVNPLNVPAMIEEFAPLLEAVVPKGAELIVEPAEDVPMVKADAAQIKQVLMNLVLNAVESLEEEQGKIRVGVRQCTIDHEFTVDSNHPLPAIRGRYVAIEVADNGVGMAADQLRRVCDPFYSTKFVGRGLGLSAVHGIVQSHHGGMHIASEPGCGTTVEILLPVDAGLTHAGDPAKGRPSAAHTILVVDDEAAVRDVVRDILESAGFQVLHACDGQECLEIVTSDHAPIDLVILDLTMPKMNGEETLEKLRACRPQLPVILASGYSQQQLEERFNGTRPSAFLQKPFNAQHLLETVRTGFSLSN